MDKITCAVVLDNKYWTTPSVLWQDKEGINNKNKLRVLIKLKYESFRCVYAWDGYLVLVTLT